MSHSLIRINILNFLFNLIYYIVYIKFYAPSSSTSKQFTCIIDILKYFVNLIKCSCYIFPCPSAIQRFLVLPN